MSPSLMGRHRVVSCPHCEIQYREPEKWSVPPGDTYPCWHCGNACQSSDSPVFPGDVVRLIPWNGADQASRGDLVAIDYRGVLRVKRIIGLPGDTIDVHRQRLRVNEKDVQSGWQQEVRILVDSDTLRSESRWQPNPGRWVRADRCWQSDGVHPNSDSTGILIESKEVTEEANWLVYCHQNVHAGNRPSPVRDDYPGNTRLVRPLHDVERLVLTLNASYSNQAEHHSPQDRSTIRVVFWTINGPRQLQARLTDELQLHRFDSKKATQVGPLSVVSADRPVAIEASGDCFLSGLILERAILYRLNRSHDQSVYPLQLGDGECFVLGDNVPLSVDSRDWGPIPLDSIRAQVFRPTIPGDPTESVEESSFGKL